MLSRFFKNFFKALITKVSKFIETQPRLFDLLYNYYDWATNLTSKIFFDFRISLPLFFLLYALPIYYYPEMGEYFLFIGSGGSILKGFYLYISLALKIVLLTYFPLFGLVIINTLLTSLPCLTTRLKKFYGDDVIKVRHYNSTKKTLIYTFAGVFCWICGQSTGGNIVNDNFLRDKIEAHNEAERKLYERTGKPPHFFEFPKTKSSIFANLRDGFTVKVDSGNESNN